MPASTMQQHDRDPHDHGHGHHDHGHGSAHAAPLEGESYAHVRGGPPVLDIGGDIGALLVTMDPDTAGAELHLRSEHAPPIDIHTGIWHRTNGEQQVTTAVFAELSAGTYRVLDPPGNNQRRVVVRGGELARLDLRSQVDVRPRTHPAGSSTV